MQSPLEIRSEGVPLVEPLDELIRSRAGKLEGFFDGIISCRVTVRQPPGHSLKGTPYEIDINLGVPGEHLVINRQKNPDLNLAVGEAFDAMERRLEDYARRTRGDVKTNVSPPRGVVKTVFAADGYGFIESEDGREIYFHRNSVLEPGFEALEPGIEVRYAEEQGDEGPQASTVSIAGRSGAPETT